MKYNQRMVIQKYMFNLIFKQLVNFKNLLQNIFGYIAFVFSNIHTIIVSSLTWFMCSIFSLHQYLILLYSSSYSNREVLGILFCIGHY